MEREKLTSIKEEILKPDSDKLGNVAVIYAKVFAGWPWYEVSKGISCGRFYGPELPPGSPCPCGSENLEEAYPKDETLKYIAKELSKPLALGIILSISQEPCGFGWGYKLNGRDFAETKYTLANFQRVIVSIIGTNDYFYISEVGIVPEFQKNGLGYKVTSTLADQATLYRLPILMRTNNESPMVNVAKKLGMIEIQGPTSGLLDPENPERVVFTRI